jgi:hypothetical protein
VNDLFKVINGYRYLSKKGMLLLESWIEKDLEKAKRNYFKEYRIEPNENEIQEFKNSIVMKKGVVAFLLLFFLVLYISIKW